MASPNDPEAPPGTDSSELSDDQLESVTGGVRVIRPAFPSVPKLPAPGGPVPVPYPNAGIKD